MAREDPLKIYRSPLKVQWTPRGPFRQLIIVTDIKSLFPTLSSKPIYTFWGITAIQFMKEPRDFLSKLGTPHHSTTQVLSSLEQGS